LSRFFSGSQQNIFIVIDISLIFSEIEKIFSHPRLSICEAMNKILRNVQRTLEKKSKSPEILSRAKISITFFASISIPAHLDSQMELCNHIDNFDVMITGVCHDENTDPIDGRTDE